MKPLNISLTKDYKVLIPELPLYTLPVIKNKR